MISLPEDPRAQKPNFLGLKMLPLYERTCSQKNLKFFLRLQRRYRNCKKVKSGLTHPRVTQGRQKKNLGHTFF